MSAIGGPDPSKVTLNQLSIPQQESSEKSPAAAAFSGSPSGLMSQPEIKPPPAYTEHALPTYEQATKNDSLHLTQQLHLTQHPTQSLTDPVRHLVEHYQQQAQQSPPSQQPKAQKTTTAPQGKSGYDVIYSDSNPSKLENMRNNYQNANLAKNLDAQLQASGLKPPPIAESAPKPSMPSDIARQYRSQLKEMLKEISDPKSKFDAMVRFARSDMANFSEKDVKKCLNDFLNKNPKEFGGVSSVGSFLAEIKVMNFSPELKAESGPQKTESATVQLAAQKPLDGNAKAFHKKAILNELKQHAGNTQRLLETFLNYDNAKLRMFSKESVDKLFKEILNDNNKGLFTARVDKGFIAESLGLD